MGVLFSGTDRGLFVVYVILYLASPLLLQQIQSVNSEPTQDKQALVAFISQIPHANRLQWNQSDSACNWVGVECDPNQSYVYIIRLPGVGLVGPIPPNTLGNLTQLRVLSLRANRLTGQLPADFSNLKFLRSLFLQNNQLSGEFPPSLPELTRLTRLDISTNNFTGKIPLSVNNLARLTRLFMENNNFSGPLPSINPPGLVDFNVSNNHLRGLIPTSLIKFPSSAFAGNINLCGGPLQQCPFFPSPAPSPFPPPKQNPSHKKLSKAVIIAIAVGGAVILILLLLCLIICLMKRRQENQPPRQPKPAAGTRSAAVAAEAGTSSSKDDIAGVSGERGGGGGGGGGRRNNLVFVNGGVYNFDLEDLLRASAEVLGKGSVGTSYKAVLEEGTAVVVKRLKEVALTEKEFEMQMQALGKINHDNVVPLRAFYFSKDEKLLVSDYMAAGSLSALLHGSRGSGRPPLDWDSRMRIATSAARGLTHLHVSGRVVHGNIKSSNILLRHQDNHAAAAVSDFGLNSLFDESGSPSHRVAGYRAPEVVETRKVTFKSDVYSFGVLLLELLTGKAPNQASLGDEGIDLRRWVQSVVSEEWTAEVFDSELMRYDNMEEEMVQLLQIAMACVAIVPDQRPAMQEVVRMIEDMNMNTTETDDRVRLSSDDPSRVSEDPTPTGFRTPPRSVTLAP